MKNAILPRVEKAKPLPHVRPQLLPQSLENELQFAFCCHPLPPAAFRVEGSHLLPIKKKALPGSRLQPAAGSVPPFGIRSACCLPSALIRAAGVPLPVPWICPASVACCLPIKKKVVPGARFRSVTLLPCCPCYRASWLLIRSACCRSCLFRNEPGPRVDSSRQ